MLTTWRGVAVFREWSARRLSTRPECGGNIPGFEPDAPLVSVEHGFSADRPSGVQMRCFSIAIAGC